MYFYFQGTAGLIIFVTLLIPIVICFFLKHRLHTLDRAYAQASDDLKLEQARTVMELTNCMTDKGQLQQALVEQKQLETSAVESLKHSLQSKQEAWMAAQIELNVLKEKFQAAQAQINWFSDTEARMLEQFKRLTSHVLEEQGEKSLLRGQEKMKNTLHPLETQLEKFQHLLGEYFRTQRCDREIFVHELQKLQSLNLNLCTQADNLTKALKGDKKLQGIWGELLLEKALEASGLRKESEYRLQVALSKEAQSGQWFQPDAVVYLPNERMVIIDAKLSLSAYERYANAPSASDQQQAMQSHIAAVRSHIRKLSEKRYFQSPEVKSLDYILMFIPLEPSFNLILQRAPELLAEAQANQVMLVGPSTLLIALKTIQSLWQVEKQQLYAKEISEKAAGLYDKFRLMVKSLQTLGEALDKAQTEFSHTMNRLCQGKGNLLRQIEGFREMGVPVKKPLCEPQMHYKQNASTLPQEALPSTLGGSPKELVEPAPNC